VGRKGLFTPARRDVAGGIIFVWDYEGQGKGGIPLALAFCSNFDLVNPRELKYDSDVTASWKCPRRFFRKIASNDWRTIELIASDSVSNL